MVEDHTNLIRVDREVFYWSTLKDDGGRSSRHLTEGNQ